MSAPQVAHDRDARRTSSGCRAFHARHFWLHQRFGFRSRGPTSRGTPHPRHSRSVISTPRDGGSPGISGCRGFLPAGISRRRLWVEQDQKNWGPVGGGEALPGGLKILDRSVTSPGCRGAADHGSSRARVVTASRSSSRSQITNRSSLRPATCDVSPCPCLLLTLHSYGLRSLPAARRWVSRACSSRLVVRVPSRCRGTTHTAHATDAVRRGHGRRVRLVRAG
jgi:hypothetical protein